MSSSGGGTDAANVEILHRMVARNDVAGVEQQLAAGVAVDGIDPLGFTPLMAAADKNHLGMSDERNRGWLARSIDSAEVGGSEGEKAVDTESGE